MMFDRVFGFRTAIARKRNYLAQSWRGIAAGLIVTGTIAGVTMLGGGSSLLAQTEAGAGQASEPAVTGGPTMVRRLNEHQYKRSIADIFGADIKVPGRFEPPLREEGLVAIGDGKVSLSPSGVEQSELRARDIAAQVLAADRRDAIVPCKPVSAKSIDRACTSAFLRKYGELLFRRPLTSHELKDYTNLAVAGGRSSGSFYKGLELGLARLLVSPNFIFRIERSVADPKSPGTLRLDDYSLASRISFLLWDAPPDAELLRAAATGALKDPTQLRMQVDRLTSSARFADGVRAFFSDMFAYEQFDGLTKDQTIYPKYSSKLAVDAREQTLRTVVDLLVTNSGDYRDLFTTKKTFINRNLGALYKVPVPGSAFDGWAPYSFAANDPRQGILTFAAFLMLDPTHEGRSSPTIRGKTVRELLLCQKVPPPPPNVNFSIVQDVNDPNHKTARERLTAHQENPACAGCHAITDPIGLGMENYDAVGDFRTHENSALIDASGKFEGKPYVGLIGLSQLLHDSPAIPRCLVQRAYEYGVGRQPTTSEQKWLGYAGNRFAADNYAIRPLMTRITLSRPFSTATPEGKAAEGKPAQKIAAR
jgi:hypothetical protein